MLSDISPFRVAGNLYFVGTYNASSHLIDTGEGLILIDTGCAETAPVIVESMKLLGFDIGDVRYILHSHGHYDHTGGTAELLRMCHAKTLLHPADRIYLDGLEESFVPDIDLVDGYVLELGNTRILCRHTPGHTEGCFSFFFDIEEGGRHLRAGTFGGAGTKQLRRSQLDRYGISYFARRDFLRSIEMLEQESVDVFFGNHSWHCKTRENYELSLSCGYNPFIDGNSWGAFLDETRRKLVSMLGKGSRKEFINYAHRGASEYAPENTMSSFDLGVKMGADGIETDVRLSRDGVPVLFHDGSLLRMTGVDGAVEDYTLEELRSIPIKKGELEDRIVTLDEFLCAFGGKGLRLAIELKGDGVARATAELLEKHSLSDGVVITSFKYSELLDMKVCAPHLKLGYLAKTVDSELLERMYRDGIDELCPPANLVTPELVAHWHALGFNVRAWGVKSDELMERALEAWVDGMTVNFPDRLVARLAQETENKED